jgi:hypothetical protein
MSFDISIPLSNIAVLPPSSTTNRPKREFLTPIENEPGNYLLVIDNTAAEKIIRCPTAGYYYIICGREPHAKNAALTFGGAIHQGIELLLLGKSIEEQNTAIHQYFIDNPAPPDEYRTVQMAVEVLRHYREQRLIRADYREEKVLSDDEGLITERAFELPLGVLEIDEDIRLPQWEAPKRISQIHVAWSGRIDRLAYLGNMDRVVDVKTTSIGGDQFIQSFQLSNQTIGYLWASRQMWPSFDLRGFAIDAIHLKKPTKSGYGDLMSRGPRGGEPPLQFFRPFFEYSFERIAQWQHNMLTIIEDFVHCLVRNFFPLYTNHCFNKFGRCPYFDVDTLDNPEIRMKLLNSDAFKNVTWDPTERR